MESSFGRTAGAGRRWSAAGGWRRRSLSDPADPGLARAVAQGDLRRKQELAVALIAKTAKRANLLGPRFASAGPHVARKGRSGRGRRDFGEFRSWPVRSS